MPSKHYLWGIALLALLLAGCKTTDTNWPRLDRGLPAGVTDPASAMPLYEVATDPTYGYSLNNPIKVGGGLGGGGSRNQRLYLSALAGPNGEPITFERLGSCCEYETPGGIMGVGLLDRYAVAYDGIGTPAVLYLTFYDEEELRAPVGFTIAQPPPD